MSAFSDYETIINGALLYGRSEESNISYLQKEIEVALIILKELGGVIPTRPRDENLENLKCYLFGLLAQKIALQGCKIPATIEASSAFSTCEEIITFSLRSGSDESKIRYLQKEIDFALTILESLSGVIPPQTQEETVEMLELYLFGLLAQKAVLFDINAQKVAL